MTVDKFLSKEQQKAIEDAIKSAEHNTSGEIRVHIENEVKEDVLDRAAYMFKMLKMHKTAERNGVLFYLAVKTKKFAIIGDAGINKRVPENFWDNIKERMLEQFSDGKFTEGLVLGLKMAGEQLKKHFPYQKDDVNELSDEISFGKN
jgi:uncharacterized membrane protein